MLIFPHPPELPHPPRPPRISRSADPETGLLGALHGRVSPIGWASPHSARWLGTPYCPRQTGLSENADSPSVSPAKICLLSSPLARSSVARPPVSSIPDPAYSSHSTPTIHPDSPFWGNKNSKNQIASPTHPRNVPKNGYSQRVRVKARPNTASSPE